MQLSTQKFKIIITKNACNLFFFKVVAKNVSVYVKMYFSNAVKNRCARALEVVV